MTSPSPFYLKQLEVGMMQNFNYLIGDPETKECAWVDPAWEVDRLLKMAKADGYQIKKILLTHNHFDHIDGVPAVVKATGAEVYIHPEDEAPVRKKAAHIIPATAGMEFKIGHLKVAAIHTPGHTPGSTCYLVEDLHLVTGDTLFQGNCGRCDLPGSSPQRLFESLQHLKSLDPSTKVYPGHDYGTRTVTTIGYEKEHNPTMQVGFFRQFQEIP
ncbi:MAG: MBL fold metallo-hydrolase [Deltaproteobacteria bacterium]|nr:MBL fold metallo-hydrolase [Deltaproteobacteria bacterium]